MDMLALRLDQSNPGSQHLAAKFNVPEKVKMKCQYSRENSPTKHMLEIKQSAEDTHFSVQDLIDGLRAISRNDLVKKVEDCLPGKFCCELQLASLRTCIGYTSLVGLENYWVHFDSWQFKSFNVNREGSKRSHFRRPTIETDHNKILLYSRASNELITPHASSRVCNQLEFTTNVCWSDPSLLFSYFTAGYFIRLTQ